MDDMNKRGKPPQEIFAKIQAARDRKGESGPSKDGVYRFLSGHTYKRGAKENRGRRCRLAVLRHTARDTNKSKNIEYVRLCFGSSVGSQ